jgi:prepilin-type processing-associated H-X9-DG protein
MPFDPRHSGGFNVACVDGSVRLITQAKSSSVVGPQSANVTPSPGAICAVSLGNQGIVMAPNPSGSVPTISFVSNIGYATNYGNAAFVDLGSTSSCWGNNPYGIGSAIDGNAATAIGWGGNNPTPGNYFLGFQNLNPPASIGMISLFPRYPGSTTADNLAACTWQVIGKAAGSTTWLLLATLPSSNMPSTTTAQIYKYPVTVVQACTSIGLSCTYPVPGHNAGDIAEIGYYLYHY